MSDWSKLSSSIFSQASGALTEAKQRVSQTISEKDLDPQNIDWSKVSGDVLSRASGALTEARQLVNQAASQRDINLQNVDWSKLSGNVISRASDALTDAKQLSNQIASQIDRELTKINWSKLLDDILSHASSALTIVRQLVDQVFIHCNWRDAMTVVSQQYQEKLQPFIEAIPNILHNYLANLWGSILSSFWFPLTLVNNWSIRHPYKSVGALLLISAFSDPAVFMTLLQLTGKTTAFLCFLLARLIIRCFGFGSRGVEKGSFASQYQSRHYGGNVPRGSIFATLQSYGATMPIATLVSLLSYAGAVIILGREWGRLFRLGNQYHLY